MSVRCGPRRSRRSHALLLVCLCVAALFVRWGDFFSPAHFAAAATTMSATGRELAELLESEAAQSRSTHPPYALFHAFSEVTQQKVVQKSLLDNIARDGITQKSFLAERSDGLMELERTVVSKGVNATVDVCFHFHQRYFFRPDKGDINASALQLWPYFYQYKDFLQSVPAQTYTQTHRGVLDIDGAAFSLLEEMRDDREIELVLFAYNDWDAHVDEALAALADFTARHSAALYRPDGLDTITSKRARRCGQTTNTGAPPPKAAVVAVQRNGLDWIGDSLAAQGTIAESATYAALNLGKTAEYTEGALQLVGAARMAAFAGAMHGSVEDFRELHRSASPRLYFLTSENMGQLDLTLTATSAGPPSVLAQRGFSSFDVHSFIHQHSRSSFLLASPQAYQNALQLHRRVLVLVGHPARLPASWWTSLSGPPQVHTASVRALRRHTPFFLSESATPIANLLNTSTTPPGKRQLCVLPVQRINIEHEARARYDAATVAAHLRTLRWDATALQLRMVQQRHTPEAGTTAASPAADAARRGEDSCQWVQQVEVPYPTNATDLHFYDTVVFSAVAEWVRRVQVGEENWIARIRTTAQFSDQLDELLQPAVHHPTGHPAESLVLTVDTAGVATASQVDCASGLQRLQLLERNKNGAAEAAAPSTTYAALSARLSTVEAELRLAAQPLSATALPSLLPRLVNASSAAAWAAFIDRCPIFVILRETEEIFYVTGAAPATAGATGTEGHRDLASYPPVPSAASLEVVEDGPLAVALLDLHRQLSNEDTHATDAEAAREEKELLSQLYASPHTAQRWRAVLPKNMEAPLVVYELTAEARALLQTSLPATEPTFVLLTQSECGVCSNYAKAFELLRRTYRRVSGAGAPPQRSSTLQQQQEQHYQTALDGETAHPATAGHNRGASFVLLDLALGFEPSRTAEWKRLNSSDSRAHWQRAQHLLLPFYLTNVKSLKVPQLLLVNATHVVTTLPTEAYAERWHWPHAVLRLMALADSAVDVEATKTAMWTVLEAERQRRSGLRGAAP